MSIISDQAVILVGGNISGENFSKSEYEERDVSNSSKLSSESFDFGIERFCRGVCRTILKVVYDSSVVVLHRGDYRISQPLVRIKLGIPHHLNVDDNEQYIAKGCALIRANFQTDPLLLTEEQWAERFSEAVWIENTRLMNLAKVLSKLFSNEES